MTGRDFTENVWTDGKKPGNPPNSNIMRTTTVRKEEKRKRREIFMKTKNGFPISNK
jgi:hypothetical protein